MISIQEVLFKEAYIISQNAKNIGNQLDPIIDLIIDNVNQSKHLIICGIGKNSDIAKKMAATYSSIGIPSFYLDAYNSLHGDLGTIFPNQLIISYSKSGNTNELLHTFEAAGRKGAKLISITCNANSKIKQIIEKYQGIDVALNCEFEADALNLAPTASSTLFLAIGDAIGCAVSAKLNFTKEQFLLNHPAGSLGEQLLLELKKE